MAGNSNSGRRPQPTALKVLRGNPGKRDISELEPKPPDGAVKRPEGLSTGAKAVWNDVSPTVLAMGTLTVADVRAFVSYCELQATFDAEVAKKDLAPGEFSARLERETAVALKAYYDYFGMTPSARSRIRVAKAEQPVSKWAGLIG